MKVKYINCKTSEGVETIDELPYNNQLERKEFKRVIDEYRLAYQGTGINVYSSQRATKEWRNSY